ncbi:succinate dehydrogenase, cytochrome b556 subunit [Streptomyces sp. NBC_01485]|uniref:succinate dehydrogenase, cytochrome b556 subunit n=1 Tax=Streptomyces sp. NBC_01485 TaxID=2903884 RepID=UPI002E2EC13B|nr:succinate dehydrogenase, cytochrome b556 subunit [Streptomyces sp. NBC_01485]
MTFAAPPRGATSPHRAHIRHTNRTNHPRCRNTHPYACHFDHTGRPGVSPAPAPRYDAGGRWTVPGRARPTAQAGGPNPRSRRASVPAGTLYRGREGMWSWVAHRVTGVLIFFFLFVHVLDTALVRVSPEDYDKVVATYKTPIVALLEYGLVAAILFHALNGLRVIAVDFWSKGPRYQKQMLWSVVGLWLVLMLGAIYPVLGHAARELLGS